MSDPFNLQRFLDAQEQVYDAVLAELRQGQKQTHWIWFIFPQMRGLAHSRNSDFYGIGSKAEAFAYLLHPVLGSRLMECTQLVIDAGKASISDILPNPDDAKFRSCMTLFSKVATQPIFQKALERYFNGVPDIYTLEKLEAAGG